MKCMFLSLKIHNFILKIVAYYAHQEFIAKNNIIIISLLLFLFYFMKFIFNSILAYYVIIILFICMSWSSRYHCCFVYFSIHASSAYLVHVYGIKAVFWYWEHINAKIKWVTNLQDVIVALFISFYSCLIYSPCSCTFISYFSMVSKQVRNLKRISVVTKITWVVNL